MSKKYESKIRQAIGRSYCHKKNSNKPIDTDLAASIVSEIMGDSPYVCDQHGETCCHECSVEKEILRKSCSIMQQALEYFSKEDNWIVDTASGYVDMLRPGGGRQDGIFLISHNLKPWILAQEVLNRKGTYEKA